jgi:PAS domain S-box-containing protein
MELHKVQNELKKLQSQLEDLRNENEILNDDLAALKNFNKLSLLSELPFEGVFFHAGGVCKEVNQAFCNITGYSREELLGKNLIELLVLPESIPTIEKNMHFEHALPYRLNIIRKDKTLLLVEIESKFVRFDENQLRVTAVRDISDKLKAEKDLAESEERYKIAFKTSPDAININKLDGTYVDINEGFTKLTGFNREDVIGKSSKEIQIWAVPEDREKLIAGLKLDGLVENLETTFRYKDGSLKTGLMSARLLRLNNQPHILSISRDISQRKIMENELIAAKEKAEESDRLKSAFLANMSHEIRTPMNGLVGFVELLTKQDVNEKKKNLYKRIINDSCQRLLNIINDILDISKIETKQYPIKEEEINLNEFMVETYSLFIPVARQKNIDIHFVKGLRNKESYIITDAQKLKQIMNNLISNAIKFTEQGSIQIGYTINNSNFLQFYVADSGVGIPENLHEIVFERFRQAECNDQIAGGTGLGLAIAKGFVELMNGKIWCDSVPGFGATFSFTLPYKKGKQNVYHEYQSHQSELNLSKTILIAEDEEINYLYLEELLLQIENINILRAMNGRDAVDLVQKNPNIDLVLMDVKMPVMGGYDATKLIKQNNPNIPVVAQTAYAMPGDEQKAIDAGCDAFIPKPIRKERFLKVINCLLLKK